ncbi:uncharacterized protein STEHIDRAFT_50128, partial [Stereum hirsutum FP-91666 SS1]|uniref:uncharacterized protein n=1 Tax=Stereum hirsutum (strain FP-91666) TaxID=721885 RepID=UPI000440A4AB
MDPSPPPATERDPLLVTSLQDQQQEGESERREDKKPFYRPRPLWLVPFAIIASITRGMTLAPRVEVFTQLSCNAIHSHYNHTSGDSTSLLSVFMPSSSLSLDPSYSSYSSSSSPSSLNSLSILFPSSSSSSDDSDNEEDPRNLPSQICLSDPAVQAGAARLQTIMTTTMGTLSALTTGWWGRLGERVGRTRVLSAAVGGMFLTDLTFILVSTPSSPLSHHGHILLLLSPLIEGSLGGWSTLQATASAYVSDCTSDGSRAHIFSRFIGVFYLGFSLGPMVGAYFIRNPLPIFSAISPSSPSHSSNLLETFASRAIPGRSGVPNVTSVFWVAILCSFVNLVFAMGFLPESMDKVKRRAAMKAREAEEAEEALRAQQEEVDEDAVQEVDGGSGVAKSKLFGPLAVFAPRKVYRTSDESGRVGGARTDWSLTLLAGSLAFYLLSSGIFQIKYLYAEHQFGWSAEQLSYYISFVGGARAICLLFVLPTIISYFKPKPVPTPITVAVADGASTLTSTAAAATTAEEALHHSITFDLTLGRLSLVLDILSHTLVSLPISDSSLRFAGLTVISCFASGMHPAAQSLAVCIMQRQALRGVGEEGDDDGHESGQGGQRTTKKKVEGMGPLFGGVAALQAMGQMILGPLIFGVLYSSTVATLPKAIFMLAGALATASLVILFLI